MSASTNADVVFEFGVFRVNAAEMKLFNGEIEIPLKPKAFDLLLILLEHPNHLVRKQTILDSLWANSFVEESNLTQNISELRKALGDTPANPRYIKTIPKRGYKFIALVKETQISQTVHIGSNSRITSELGEPASGKSELLSQNAENPSFTSSKVGRKELFNWKHFTVGSVVLFLLVGSLLVWFGSETSYEETQAEINSPIDVADIRQVVRDSQVFEFLTLDIHPDNYELQNVPYFWLPAESGGQEILKVGERLKRLKDENKRYGGESRLERFDFIYVKIYAPGNRARAGTIERWYLPLYQNGILVPDRNVYLGPYSVDYSLQKFDGRWLIESTTTPTAK